MYTTIRKNSLTKIRAILDKAALVTRYTYDDMESSNSQRVTAAEVMAIADRFDRVTVDERGCLHIHIHSNHFYNAYPSAEVARKVLTPQAFAKYFPADVEPVAAAGTRREWRGALRTESEIAELERLRRDAFPHLYPAANDE